MIWFSYPLRRVEVEEWDQLVLPFQRVHWLLSHLSHDRGSQWTNWRKRNCEKIVAKWWDIWDSNTLFTSQAGTSSNPRSLSDITKSGFTSTYSIRSPRYYKWSTIEPTCHYDVNDLVFVVKRRGRIAWQQTQNDVKSRSYHVTRYRFLNHRLFDM